MILVKETIPCEEGFTYVHGGVVRNSALSDKAKVLYLYLMCLEDGAICNDASICKALDISVATLTRAKTQLKTVGLIKSDCIAHGTWVTYIGDPDTPASTIRNRYFNKVKEKYSVKHTVVDGSNI
jgi:predicted DNA-binding transcriptional regulator